MNFPNWMKPPMRAVFEVVSRLNLLRGYDYVFILAHMRSGSTLLNHLLASHPEIVAAPETHTVYRTPSDLPQLVLKTARFLHKPLIWERFIVDQITKDCYVTDEVLLSVHKCIILIREPEATLKSMLKLLPWEEHEALNEYNNRLALLTRHGLLLRERAILVEYDDLVDHADCTLASLTSFLNLRSSLSSQYATNRMTAVHGFGDPSKNIKLGRVMRTPQHEVTISKATLVEARRAFQECKTTLHAAINSAPHGSPGKFQHGCHAAINE